MDFEEYMNRQAEELEMGFIDLKHEEFLEYCFNKYEEHQQDHADYLYEMEKDRRLEVD